MYNEEIKTKFIQDYTTSLSMANSCKVAFNAFEEFENEWDADLCTKTTEELSPIVEQLVGFRVKSKWLRLTIYKDYVRWCMVNGIPGACDGMLHVETLGLSKVRTQMVSNPKQLQLYLNQIWEPESEQTTDIIYRCFYWLAYSGMAEEDILKVKCSDVDFDNMVVKFGNKEYRIYVEALPAFRMAVKLTEFVYKHPNYTTPGKRVIRNRALGDTLIRGIRQTLSVSTIRVELSSRSKKGIEDGLTDKQLSYGRVWLSGLFYRTRENELAGIPVNFEAAASEFTEGKVYKLDTCRNTQEAVKRKVANDYLQDYQRWKAAFF